MTLLHKITLPDEAEFYLEIMDIEIIRDGQDAHYEILSYRTLDMDFQWDDKFMPLITKQMLKDIPNESTLTPDMW